jgi:hypothetical protein
LGDGGLADARHPGELPHGVRTPPEPLVEAAAGGVGQGEQGGLISHGLYKYLLTFICQAGPAILRVSPVPTHHRRQAMASIRKSAKRAKKTAKRAGGKARSLASKVAGKVGKRRTTKKKKLAAALAGAAAAVIGAALVRKRKRAR